MSTTTQLVTISVTVKNDTDWAISSQATKKLAEGSTTRHSNLNTESVYEEMPKSAGTLFVI